MTEDHQIMTLEEVLHLAGETITKNNNLKNQQIMKKLLYAFLAISIIFAACKKDKGCTDPTATNY